MAELGEVHIGRINPNPFRDIENYPFWRDKLDRLKESIKSTGQWPNIIVRKDPTQAHRWQLAFGHHRIKALEELGVETVTVIIEDLDDDQMLKMMCDENAEEFGTNFALGTMNAVDAVKKKLASDCTDASTVGANEVARFLGWTKKRDDVPAGVAQDRVVTAFNALQLIDLGVCKASAFQGLGHEQAKAVVSQAQLVYKSRLRELEKDAEEKEIRKAKAEAKKAAAENVRVNVGAIKDGAGVRQIKEETKAIREEVQPVATQKAKPVSEIDISRMMDRAAEQLVAWLENNEKVLALYGRGAICDNASWARLYKAMTRIDNAMAKVEEKREE